MRLIVGSALSVNTFLWILSAYFSEKQKWLIWSWIQTNPCRSGRRSASVSGWPEIAYFAKLISNIFQLVHRGYDPRHWNLERPSMPSLLAYNIRIYSKVEDYETKNKTCVDSWIWVRENGSSLDFNFILLLNFVVDKNWVCWHHLMQFILGKWCRVRCSELCKLFTKRKFTKRFHIFCAQIDLFIIFICSLYSPSGYFIIRFGFVCVLISGYAVHIFHAIDAKYVMFHVGWHKSLEGSATPGNRITPFFFLFWQKNGVHLTRQTLVNQCRTNPAFLSIITDMVPCFIKVIL